MEKEKENRLQAFSEDMVIYAPMELISDFEQIIKNLETVSRDLTHVVNKIKSNTE
ncbi:MAG: hypothetical protein LBE79_10605 [Tannerella sp.]|jgi:hypothetical protein|nr:hypothetical protein [Tannerella sp.]